MNSDDWDMGMKFHQIFRLGRNDFVGVMQLSLLFG
jgi:hypothetical protein